ncbi:MAG: hypothetical protein KBT29_12220 [Prevotellaceae bacterium]|nr:hypothetical protein [Candidatus Minthosoma caballi]
MATRKKMNFLTDMQNNAEAAEAEAVKNIEKKEQLRKDELKNKESRGEAGSELEKEAQIQAKPLSIKKRRPKAKCIHFEEDVFKKINDSKMFWNGVKTEQITVEDLIHDMVVDWLDKNYAELRKEFFEKG